MMPRFSSTARIQILLSFVIAVCAILLAASPIYQHSAHPAGKILLFLMRNLFVILLVLITFGIGHYTLRKSKLLSDCALFDFALSAALGFVIIACLIFLSLIPPRGFFIFLPLWLILASIAFYEIYQNIAPLIQICPEIFKEIRGVGILFLALLAAPLLYAWYYALTPPFSWDAQVYHLLIPKRLIANKGFCFLPFNVYSNMPYAMDLFYLLAMAAADDAAANLTHFALGVLVCISLIAISRRYFTPLAGIIAALLFVCHPMVIYEYGVAFIDVGLALFCLWTAASLLEWRRTGCIGYLILSGVFAGMGMGSKYTMIAGAAAAIIILLGLSFRRLQLILYFMIPAGLLIIPWLIKNYYYTGNPVYPLMYHIFGGREWSAQQAAWVVDWQRSIGIGRSFLDCLLLPFRIFMMSDMQKGYAGFAGTLYPYILILLPSALFIKKNRKSALLLFVFFAVFFAVWAMGAQQVRFLIPALPLLALCSAAGAVSLKKRNFTFLYFMALAIASIAPIHLFVKEIIPENKRDGSYLPMIFGDEKREDFLRARVRAYPCFEYLKRICSKDEPVIFLYENRGYYCSQPYFADSMFEASHFFALALEAGTIDAFADKIKNMGCRYVLIDELIRQSVKSQGATLFSKKENAQKFENALAVVERFIDIHLEKVFEENQATVYRLRIE